MSIFEKFFDTVKIDNKKLIIIILALITLIPISFVFGGRLTGYVSDLTDVKNKLNLIEAKVDETKEKVDNIITDQDNLKEKQNKIYYIVTESNKLIDDKLQFIIEHREQNKKTIIDAIKLISGTQKINSENNLIFKEKEIKNKDEVKNINKDYKIVVKKVDK